jgi:WD40 repeat protein
LFVGPNPVGTWQLEELELALVRANHRSAFRMFPVLLPGVEDPFDAQRLPPFLSTRTWVDLRSGTSSPRALQRLLNAIQGVAHGSDAPAEPLGDVVPYRGLATFEEEHAALFFGRERDIQRLIEILKTSPLLCVVGPSGSGKSSLVRAGLVPRLRKAAAVCAEDCKVCLLRPGAHPLEALATQLAPLGAGSSMHATLENLKTDRRTLHLAVSLAVGPDAPRSRVLIVVDQLEEVFTRCEDEREREQFLANLLHAAFASGGQTIVVLAMRADFYSRCAEYSELAQRTAGALALVGPMHNDELRQAIEEPARRIGLFFESGLVQTILDDVGPDAGALPLLEHALLEVWRRRLGDQLTLDGYVEAGRVGGALAQRAESVFASFTTDQQQIARRTLLRLTQPGEGTEHTRRRATRRELIPAELDQSFDVVLGRLVDARLLTTRRDETGVEVVDVSHEALIRGWPRLRRWVDADRPGLFIHRRLSDAAVEWENLRREPGALYRGARLAAAQVWAADHADDLSPLERRFLTASNAAQHIELEAGKRRTRRLRILACGLAGLTVTVAALAVWALGERDNAQRALAQRSDAQRQTTRVTSVVLTSSASALRDRRPDIALLLALEAARGNPRREARNSVLTALAAARRPGVLAILHGHTGFVRSVAFSPDRKTLASASADKTIRLWNVHTHEQLGVLIGHTGPVLSVAFSPNGSTLASGSADKTIRLWNVHTLRPISAPLTGHTSFVRSVAFSPNGGTLASASADDTVRLWNVGARKPHSVQLSGHTDAVLGVAFSRDASMLAGASFDKTIRLWNVQSREPIGAPLTDHAKPVSSVAFSHDGGTLASGSADNTVRLWNMHVPERSTALTGHTGAVLSVAFAPVGSMLASGSADNGIRLWNVHTHKRLAAPLQGHTNDVLSVAFSPDGQTLASGSFDNTVRLWDARAQNRIRVPHTDHTKPVTFTELQTNVCDLVGSGLSKTEWARYARGIPYRQSCP